MKLTTVFVRLLALSVVNFAAAGMGMAQVDAGGESLFICRITITEKCRQQGLPQNFAQLMVEHGNYLNDLGKNGVLVFAGRTKIDPVTDKSNYGLVLFKAKALEEVQKLRDGDPAVKANVQQWEFFSFSMGIRYLNNITKVD